MKEKNNIEEGFLFDAEEIGKQETDTQTSEGTESTDAPLRRGRKRSMVTEDRPPPHARTDERTSGRHHGDRDSYRHPIHPYPPHSQNVDRHPGKFRQGVHHQSR